MTNVSAGGKEIASLYLSSPESAFMIGADLIIDGRTETRTESTNASQG